jgi:hypothetical protein
MNFTALNFLIKPTKLKPKTNTKAMTKAAKNISVQIFI